MNIHIEFYLAMLIKILLAAILEEEIAKPVAMVGGIGAALVILLVVAAGALLYRYMCVSYSFWRIIFYIKLFASCGSWSIIFFLHYKLSTCLPVGIEIVPP
jgi:hypothetical protein